MPESSSAQATPTGGQAQGQQTAGLPVPPAIPGGQEVYDRIMGEIELELTSAVLPTLQEKYKSETPEQTQERLVRYEKAFAEYDRRYAEYQANLQGKVHTFHRTTIQFVEGKAKADDDNAINSLESSIANA